MHSDLFQKGVDIELYFRGVVIKRVSVDNVVKDFGPWSEKGFRWDRSSQRKYNVVLKGQSIFLKPWGELD